MAGPGSLASVKSSTGCGAEGADFFCLGSGAASAGCPLALALAACLAFALAASLALAAGLALAACLAFALVFALGVAFSASAELAGAASA